MSRYRRGDVILAHVSYMDNSGSFTSKPRPMVVIDVDGKSDNITVACTTKTHKSIHFASILVKKDSQAGKSMGIELDSLIYCNTTITLSNSDIIRRIGSCPLIKDICTKLGYKYSEDE